MKATDPPERSETPAGAVLLFRQPRARVRSRRAVLASFLAFGLIEGTIVAGVGTAYGGAWLLLVGAGLLSVVLALIDDFRWRIWEMPPYRSTGRLFVLTQESAGFREAPPPVVLHLDGQPVSLGTAPRLQLTRSRGHYRVSLVLAREILILESIVGYEAAALRARELTTVLGLPAPPASQPADVPAASDPEMGHLVFFTVCTLVSILMVVYWVAGADLPDPVGLPLTLAAVISGALFAAGQRLRLRLLKNEAAEVARFFHHLPSASATAPRSARHKRDKWFIGAMGGLVVVALLAPWWLETQDVPRPTSNCFNSKGSHLCRSDEDGDGVPEAIGRTCTSGDWSLSAVDAKSGKIVAQRPSEDSEGDSTCDLPLLRVHDNTTGRRTEVTAWSPRFNTSSSIWSATIKGKLVESLRSDECVLLHIVEPSSGDVWKAFSLATGGTCPSMADPVSDAAIDAVRFAQEKRTRGPEPGLQSLGDITYSLTGTSRLTLSAWRGETLVWTTKLPARPLDGLPLAVAGGTVVLAANDLRTGKHLRILGVDAATGEIRYVRRHPRDPKAHVDLAAAGSMVFIEAGRLAGLDAASGQIAWITKEE